MKSSQMLGLELAGLVFTVILAGLRILAAHLKGWRPKRIETFGAVSYVMACVFGVLVMVHWIRDGVRMVAWEKQGMSPVEVRKILTTVTDFKVSL